MPRQLPPQPDLEHLHKQARQLLNAHRSGDTDASVRLMASHPKWTRASDQEVRNAPISLRDAQIVVAREYGFPTWVKLTEAVAAAGKRTTERQASSPDDLIEAVKRGDPEQVRNALDAGVSVAEVTDAWGWPLVHAAALRGNLAVAKLLWEHDEKRDAGRLRRALYFALQSGDRETIRYFLGQGAASLKVMEPLYLQDLDGLRSVLEKDPSQVNARDEDGQTPLHVVANMDYRDAAPLLITSGADIEARNKAGETPFFRSISSASERVARLLLRHGADLNTVTGYGQNALHCAATAHKKGLVKLLESRGIAPAFDDLHVASALGRIERVKALLAADPTLLNRQDALEATPLYWSVSHKKTDVAEYLLSQGADPNIKEMHGRTPLMSATQRKDRAMIQLLVQHGAKA